MSLPGAMSTPPACMPTLRVSPSSARARRISSRTSSCSSSSAFSCGSASIALSSVMPSSNGINLAMRSTSPKFIPRTRPTSRTTAFAAMVPKVAICDTLCAPYLART